MTSFAIIGHLARTDGGFSINDLPGSGGTDGRALPVRERLALPLARPAQGRGLLPRPLRRAAGPKTVKFSGELVRSLSPDERSAAALIKKVHRYALRERVPRGCTGRLHPERRP